MTLREFASAAGFSAHSFITNVIKGTRSLTVESADRVGRALGFNAGERDYLCLLVRFEAAATAAEKNEIFDRLRAYFPKDVTQQLEARLYDVLREPHVISIRELISLPDFTEDPEWIAQKLRPKITSRQAKAALALLEQSGLIQRGADGKLQPSHPDMTTGREIRSLAACLYHRKVLEWAALSIDSTPAHWRDISSLTLNVSKEEFDHIKLRAAEFRAEILDFLKAKRTRLPDSHNQTDRSLYCLNIQFFNVTEIKW